MKTIGIVPNTGPYSIKHYSNIQNLISIWTVSRSYCKYISECSVLVHFRILHLQAYYNIFTQIPRKKCVVQLVELYNNMIACFCTV